MKIFFGDGREALLWFVNDFKTGSHDTLQLSSGEY